MLNHTIKHSITVKTTISIHDMNDFHRHNVEQKKPSKKGANCKSHLSEDPDQGKNQSMVTREQNSD